MTEYSWTETKLAQFANFKKQLEYLLPFDIFQKKEDIYYGKSLNYTSYIAKISRHGKNYDICIFDSENTEDKMELQIREFQPQIQIWINAQGVPNIYILPEDWTSKITWLDYLEKKRVSKNKN